MTESAPPLPAGRAVVLPGRGTTFVRELPGRPGAPTVLLLHGWTANADLNWVTSYRALANEGLHVIALDHRGHGRGIRSRRPFRMRDAADDAAAVLDVLGIDRVIAVGYSMGGAVAQLLWRRHPDQISGLVLCATSSVFAESDRERRAFTAMGALSLASRVTPDIARKAVAGWILDRRPDRAAVEWVQQELQRNDWSQVLAAGAALGRFDSRPWLGEVDVPAAVVLTRFDRVVSPRRQAAMARAIPRCVVYEVDGDHGVVAMQPDRFVPVLVRALRGVAERVDAAPRGTASSRIS